MPENKGDPEGESTVKQFNEIISDYAQDEFEMDMRLLGTPTIADIGPDLVDTRNIGAHIVAVPTDRQYDANCS